MINRRSLAMAITAIALVVMGVTAALASSGAKSTPRSRLQAESALPSNFRPAVAAAQARLGRYFVVMNQPSVAQRTKAAGGKLSAAAQKAAAKAALASQTAAIAQAKALGGTVVYRYMDLLDGFSANLSTDAASALASRSDVASVQPVSIVTKLSSPRAKRDNGSNLTNIRAQDVWKKFHARGDGVIVADVDTGIDYTHKDFGGPGTVAAYDRNNPNYIEPGTFPTKKVIDGYDLVGSNYDVIDNDPTNDTPRPDPDPLDRDSHGSHTSGTCCGNGVKGEVPKGVAPHTLLREYKVWDDGNSTDDVLAKAYEMAIDPNQDGSLADASDVITFSGGVDYGSQNSVEAQAAQRVTQLGTVFVAAAGNANNQPAGGSAYIEGTPANAPGVISVAASIDQFTATHLTVNSPSITLPQSGLMIIQDWGADLASPLTSDLFDGRAVDPAGTTPSDGMFCNPLPGGSLTGKVVLVFKGSTSSGDCAGSDKVGNAEAAGAVGVVLVSIFPSRTATSLSGDQRGIPAVMIGEDDGLAILDALSPNAPSSYNTGTVNATLDPNQVVFPEFEDSMTDFSSEGPARLTNILKPDISAPGYNVTSAMVGTGTGALTESGTSMATPNVAGVAALLVQLHPTWSVKRIKDVMMNQAVRTLKNNDLSNPVPAEVMGAGRVDALAAAKAVSVADPGSVSFGLRQAAQTTTATRSFKVTNTDSKSHSYDLSTNVHFADFDPATTSVAISKGGAFAPTASFNLGPKDSQKVKVELTLDPSKIDSAGQELGWYAYLASQDGAVRIKQSKHGNDTLNVPWHVVPQAASADSLSKDSLDVSGGSDTMTLNRGGAGTDQADLYQLGATDPVNSTGEEDITAIGARSFTGNSVTDDNTVDVPAGTDALAGISWLDFLTNDDTPTEPVEFGVQTADLHNTTETNEVDVLVDSGTLGDFADPELGADYLVVKLGNPSVGGPVCVFDLSQPDPFSDCSALYFGDYSTYNSNVFGLVVDARAIGVTNANPDIAYQVTDCTGRFSGDAPNPSLGEPAQFCDTAGDVNDSTGTYSATLNVTDPALDVSPLTCGGFFGGAACDGANPITVSNGSAAPGDDPSILSLFPQNKVSRTPTVIPVDNG